MALLTPTALNPNLGLLVLRKFVAAHRAKRKRERFRPSALL
jgi:hypothetical protein